MDSLLQYIPKTILNKTHKNPIINFHTDANEFVSSQPVKHNRAMNVIRKFLKIHDIKLSNIYVSIETEYRSYRTTHNLEHRIFSFKHNNKSFVLVIYRYGYNGWLQSVKLVVDDITVSLYELVNRTYKHYLYRGKTTYIKVLSLLS